MLDVNAGIPLADEPALLAQAIQLVQSVTDVPLSIDSSIVEALEAGCAVYQGKPLINSVTGEDEQMERVLPLVKKYGAAVVAISNDETGISEDPDVRFEVARKIVNRAADHGIPSSDVIVDPLVMPIGAMGQAGQQVFKLLRRLQTELKVNTTCGASQRVASACPNATRSPARFLAMAISNGMTSAIMSPLHDEVKKAVKAADVLAGHDQDCGAWIATYREGGGQAAGDAAGGAPAPSWWPTRTRRRLRPTEHAVTTSASSSLRPDCPSRSRRAPRCSTRLARPVPTSTRRVVDAACAGAARSCRSIGSFSKWKIDSTADSLTGWASTEEDYTGRRPILDGQRLGCAAQVCGDVVVEIPAASQVHKQVVRKSVDVGDIEIDPLVRLHYVELPKAELDCRARRAERADRHRTARRLRRHDGAHRRQRPATHRRRGQARRRTRSPSACGTDAMSAPSIRATSTVRSASRSTSVRRPSPATSSTSAPARSSPPTAS